MNVVITGGAGFIGANLCRSLVQSGVQAVIAFDDLSTGRAYNLVETGAVLFEASILDPESLDIAFANADAVVHLAARPSVSKSIVDPMASHNVNVTGTAQVLEAVRRVRHGSPPQIIIASSSSVYGANPTLPKYEELRPSPVSPYAANKLAAESYALAWGRSFGLDVLAFRFFNVFGPLQPADHDYAAVIPAFVDAALARRPLPIHGDGRQTRDFTYVDSVADVIVAAVLGRVSRPEPINLAFGGRYSLIDVIDTLETIVGYPLERQHLPSRVGDVRDSQADQTRLRSLFPDIEPVGLEEGLRKTVEWFEAAAGPAAMS